MRRCATTSTMPTGLPVCSSRMRFGKVPRWATGQEQKEQAITGTKGPIYRWRVGEVEITRVLEFEAALFEPALIHPGASAEIIAQHRAWLEPALMDPASGLMIFAFHSIIIK